MPPNSAPELSLADQPIHHLAALIADRALRPSELLQACLERIARTDGKLHAFIDLWVDDAIAAAAAADVEIAQGGHRGKLHGIPVALKDLMDVAGRRTTAGSAFWRDRAAATQTATVAQRLLTQGAILLGKTHMVEFAFGGWGLNPHLGAPWNPWDLNDHRSPGGSSSGSGVAVAAGMAPFSIGSDTGGSVRSPAAMNGVVGLKPTSGLVSNHGIVPLSQTLDSLGPLTRSVEDAALVLSGIAGFDMLDDASVTAPGIDLALLRKPIAGLLLGVVPESQLAGAAPDILRGLREAVEVLRSLGAEIVTKPLPRPPIDYCDGASAIIRAEGYANLRNVIEQDSQDFGAAVKARLLAGRGGSAVDFASVLIARRADIVAMRQAMRGFDAVLLPTTPISAPRLADIDENSMPLSDYTRMANYLGLCSLAVPSGATADGMPLSLQIVGGAFAETTILRVGWAFEQATQWHLRRPDLSALAA